MVWWNPAEGTTTTYLNFSHNILPFAPNFCIARIVSLATSCDTCIRDQNLIHFLISDF